MLNIINKFCVHKTYIASVRNVSALNGFRSHLEGQLDGIKEAGTYKKERVILSKQVARIRVKVSDQNILNFCANNYLGLSVCILLKYKDLKKNIFFDLNFENKLQGNSEVIKASQTVLDSHGAGLSSVRFICGTQVINISLNYF